MFYTVPGIHFGAKITGFSGKTTMLGRENDSSLIPLLHPSLPVFLCLVTRASTLCTRWTSLKICSPILCTTWTPPCRKSWELKSGIGFHVFFLSRQWTENKQAKKECNFALNFPVTLGSTEQCANITVQTQRGWLAWKAMEFNVEPADVSKFCPKLKNYRGKKSTEHIFIPGRIKSARVCACVCFS